MIDEVFQELGLFFIMIFLGPYIIGPPIALVWVLLDAMVERLTGWSILPADVRGSP